jgi:organic radical activating enzyme
MKRIQNLEMHAWHGCNLACESCSHFSSLNLRGGPSAEDCRSWMAVWRDRLEPVVFSVLGGEPAMNREFVEIVEAAVECWPRSHIRVVTNGFYLHRHPRLPEVMTRAARSTLEVNSHHTSEAFQRRFSPIRELVGQWQQTYGLHVRLIEASRKWSRRYEADDEAIRFYDSDARKAWTACVGKYCTQLHDGRLWKCAPAAYFKMVARTRRTDESASALFRGYAPLAPSAGDAELDAFFAREDESICRLCPERLERFDLPMPLGRRTRPLVQAAE